MQVNTFVIHTAGLLNRFSVLCERKLEAVDRCVSPFHVNVNLSLEGVTWTCRRVLPLPALETKRPQDDKIGETSPSHSGRNSMKYVHHVVLYMELDPLGFVFLGF